MADFQSVNKAQWVGVCFQCVVDILAASAAVSIHDFECGNARIKRTHGVGRPTNLSTTSAKVVLGDALNAYYRAHGKWPRDLVGSALTALKARMGAATNTAARKPQGTRSAWDAFRLEYIQRAKEVNPSSIDIVDQQFQLELGLAWNRQPRALVNLYHSEIHAKKGKHKCASGPTAAQDGQLVATSSSEVGGAEILPYSEERHIPRSFQVRPKPVKRMTLFLKNEMTRPLS